MYIYIYIEVALTWNFLCSISGIGGVST